MEAIGWSESDVDEIVDAMHRVYDNPAEARAQAATCAEKIKSWTWSKQHEKPLRVVYDTL